MGEPKEIKIHLKPAQAEVIAEFLAVVGNASDELWREQRHGLSNEECDTIKSHVINQLKEQAYA